MESLTRLVSESLARHGFERPLDYRRLRWSRWFRCESHHSLLSVPSRPGVFAVAEEVMNLAERPTREAENHTPFDGQSKAAPLTSTAASSKPEGDSRRMLAVTKFFEDDDMAFTLDRMLSWENPMRARLESGRYFIRYVEIEDPEQRRGICNTLNQWMSSSAELVTGIGSHFATSLELTPGDSSVARTSTAAISNVKAQGMAKTTSAPPLAAKPENPAAVGSVACPPPVPSGF